MTLQFELGHPRVVGHPHRLVAYVDQALHHRDPTPGSDQPGRQPGVGQRTVDQVGPDLGDRPVEAPHQVPAARRPGVALVEQVYRHLVGYFVAPAPDCVLVDHGQRVTQAPVGEPAQVGD